MARVQLVLLFWSNQLEVMDELCRLTTVVRGGQLLNQLILLEENESNEQKKRFYRDVLEVASREYFAILQDFIYRGVVRDPFGVGVSRAFHAGVHGDAPHGVAGRAGAGERVRAGAAARRVARRALGRR